MKRSGPTRSGPLPLKVVLYINSVSHAEEKPAEQRGGDDERRGAGHQQTVLPVVVRLVADRQQLVGQLRPEVPGLVHREPGGAAKPHTDHPDQQPNPDREPHLVVLRDQEAIGDGHNLRVAASDLAGMGEAFGVFPCTRIKIDLLGCPQHPERMLYVFPQNFGWRKCKERPLKP